MYIYVHETSELCTKHCISTRAFVVNCCSSSSSSMGLLVLLLFSVFPQIMTSQANGDDHCVVVPFDQNYNVTWSNDHVSILENGSQIQLSFDASSGAGFASKLEYDAGLFGMQMKIPDNDDSTCVVTTFYLNSADSSHAELDMEFLGGTGSPFKLQTNVYANGTGKREQRVNLWFDPTSDFHDYRILWNQNLIVFFVDWIPIRVFKNNTEIGVSYPTAPMRVTGSIWTADWACVGGNSVNWTQAPFKANYKGFDIQGYQSWNITSQQEYSHSWWNTNHFTALNPEQLHKYRHVRTNYMFYDYCTDKTRYPEPPPECLSNQ